MIKPQDTEEAANHNHVKAHDTSSMDDDASVINGGIHNDDISETMLQDGDNNSDENTLSEPLSQADNQGDHDL